ncbi:hypothetical protein YW5DRAFT_07203 [Streptomyces sp. Ncost-T6T-1]|nr:hypothetical protein YW5DRAFT_07203 [Streptomyces sp. Ncost-T6T-1]
MPAIVPLSSQLGYVLVDFGLQCSGQHAACALADEIVDQGAGLRGAVGIYYAEHGRTFPTRAATRAYSVDPARG